MGLPTLTYEDPTAVQVSSDTLRDVTLPSITTFAVTGNVSGLNQLTANQGSLISFVASNLRAGATVAFAEGSYQARLPNGTYMVTLQVSQMAFSATQTANLTAYNLGSLTVNGADASANFSVPDLSRISGTVSAASFATIPQNSFVVATDTSAPIGIPFGCVFPVASSSAAIDAPGPYQMDLVTGRTFNVRVSIPVAPGGVATFPDTGRQVSVSGNATQDFSLGALPALVTISGVVTDPAGKGVQNVGVRVSTEQITGLPEATFGGGKATDANGAYSVQVLSGTDYQITLTPPLPTP